MHHYHHHHHHQQHAVPKITVQPDYGATAGGVPSPAAFLDAAYLPLHTAAAVATIPYTSQQHQHGQHQHGQRRGMRRVHSGGSAGTAGSGGNDGGGYSHHGHGHGAYLSNHGLAPVSGPSPSSHAAHPASASASAFPHPHHPNPHHAMLPPPPAPAPAPAPAQSAASAGVFSDAGSVGGDSGRSIVTSLTSSFTVSGLEPPGGAAVAPSSASLASGTTSGGETGRPS
jgi:hypothetical protein